MTDNEKLPRKQREQQRHKEEIVDAAMKLFSQKGFHNVSMQEIATEAEFAIGTLYNFFASKEALYEEIMEQSTDRVHEIIDPILAGDMDECEKIASLIRASVGISEKNAPAIRLFLQANQGRVAKFDPAMLSPNAAKFHETLLAGFAETFATGARKGIFQDVDPRVAALALDATLRALIFSAAQDSQENLLEQRVADFERLFFKGILRSQEDNHA